MDRISCQNYLVQEEIKMYKSNGDYVYPVPQVCPLTPSSLSDDIWLKVEIKQSEKEQEKLQGKEIEVGEKRIDDSLTAILRQVVTALTVKLYLCSNSCYVM